MPEYRPLLAILFEEVHVLLSGAQRRATRSSVWRGILIGPGTASRDAPGAAVSDLDRPLATQSSGPEEIFLFPCARTKTLKDALKLLGAGQSLGRDAKMQRV